MSAKDDNVVQQQSNSFYAAIARTAARSLALYFSRPVRLFRPSKVSGWHSLRGLADSHGQSLSPQYISWLVKEHGWSVIPKHFVPPMLVNGLLGVVLWSTYSEVSSCLEPHLASHPTTLAALSGACAGGAQALVAAPAENMRFALEGTSRATGWSDAWKEVFLITKPTTPMTPSEQLREARQVRDWMREVGEMAGRGWEGWGWGCAKDICGFAAFFAIFDVTRRCAIEAKATSQALLDRAPQVVVGSESESDNRVHSVRRHTPRVVHAATLVTGGAIAGLSYEILSRPWDAMRRAVHHDRLAPVQHQRSIAGIILHKAREDGVLSFFTSPAHAHHDPSPSRMRRRLNTALRTLGRVGPWGVGFLAWEAFGPGLS
ncbi:hypothetical protein DICSQDRAFT_97718 [Dichomitus squalens LYAD-421 SS1]|uniref:uncharacterized protein n=1 Tax=Dichomitus squalens (strain LYAD-421) TaxID=732165 RepID=UPI0004415EE1|nr:uncharacterized protein DICSQDRAFT_97718 [Dichomitus squalens LYAD-421 SS1]EJF66019.1 hypothetical protein DICSQDRAFT_97718 [Dichomitus squalens LYAD-421 SS1]